MISLHTPLGGEEDGGELLDTIPDTVDHAGDYVVRTASRREIQEFSEKLAQFGLTFSDVADNCPRQERTFAACRRVLDFARTQPELLKRVEDTGKLPMGELAAGSGTDKKTMERHRKYLVAILLAFTNGYEIIRVTCARWAPREGATRRELSGHGGASSLCGGAGRGGPLFEGRQPALSGGDTVRDIVELRRLKEKRPALWKPLSGVAGLAACLCIVFFGYYQPNFTPYGALRIQINRMWSSPLAALTGCWSWRGSTRTARS